MSQNNLDKIEHIVVLMMENRSFDNVLGFLYDPDNAPPFNKSPKGKYHGVNSNMNIPGVDGKPVYVKRNRDNFIAPFPDPNEPYEFVYSQLFDIPIADAVTRPPPHIQVPTTTERPNMQGFVKDYATAIAKADLDAKKSGKPPSNASPDGIMDCFAPEALPAISGLAQAYAVCDHWFSSVPSQTFPNRSFVHAATSSGNMYNTWKTGEQKSDPVDMFVNDTTTIYNLLEDKASWKVYYGGPLLLCTTLLNQKRLWKYSVTDHFSPFRVPRSFDKHTFFNDLENNNLPAYSFIEPNMMGSDKYGPENDMHPDHGIGKSGPPSDVRNGDKLVFDTYNAIRNSEYWDKTLFVVTFDEHGGCFDHLAPPEAAVPPDDITLPYTNGWNGGTGFDFKSYGVRVPAIVVSPWIEEGTICNTLFDHASIIKTVSNKWLNGQHLTNRDKAATDLSEVLNSPELRKDNVHIIEPTPPEFVICEDKGLSGLQQHALIAAAKFAEEHGIKVDFDHLDTSHRATEHFDSHEEKLRSR